MTRILRLIPAIKRKLDGVNRLIHVNQTKARRREPLDTPHQMIHPADAAFDGRRETPAEDEEGTVAQVALHCWRRWLPCLDQTYPSIRLCWCSARR
jgi:hypothetical protein